MYNINTKLILYGITFATAITTIVALLLPKEAAPLPVPEPVIVVSPPEDMPILPPAKAKTSAA
jgi:hypothetical protein